MLSGVGSKYNKMDTAMSSVGWVICWLSPPTVGLVACYYYKNVEIIFLNQTSQKLFIYW